MDVKSIAARVAAQEPAPKPNKNWVAIFHDGNGECTQITDGISAPDMVGAQAVLKDMMRRGGFRHKGPVVLLTSDSLRLYSGALPV